MDSDMTGMPNYDAIIHRLRGLRVREEDSAVRRAVYLTIVSLACIIAIAGVTEALAYLSIAWRTVLFSFVVLALSGTAMAISGRPVLRRLGVLSRKTDDEIALQAGLFFPHMRDRLLNVLQVHRELRAAGHAAYSVALADASFGEVSMEFAKLDLTPVTDRGPERRALRIMLIGLAVIAVLFAVFPVAIPSALGRIMHFRTDFAPPAPFEFNVKPGDCEVVKGERLVISASTTAWNSPRIRFWIREAGRQDFESISPRTDSAGRYEITLESVRAPMVYYAEAEGYRSRQYHIEVVDRPFVRDLRLRLAYPSYSKLQPRYLDDNTGDVTALAGTTIDFELRMNKEVKSAEVVFSDSSTMSLAVKGAVATGSMRLTSDRNYTIRLIDASGLTNINPVTYSLKTVPDMAPSIALISPDRNGTLDEHMSVAVMSRIADDFGFSKLVLHYRLAASKYEKAEDAFRSIQIPLPSAQRNEMDVPYLWNLASMNLVPEDVVEFYVEVFDNDAVHGPKSARTPTLSLRLPSMEEVFAQADRVQDKAVNDMQKVTNEATQMRKEIESLQRELRRQNQEKPDWQQKKKFEDLMKRQERMMDKLQDLNEQMRQLNENLQKQMVISPETMQKYEELRKLMEELNAPQFREAMQKMTQNMQQMNTEQMKQAMENFKMNEEAFRQSVDRTIELLKRLQIEQKTDELTKRAEDLAKKQEELANKTDNADPKNKDELERLAREQRELQKQAEAMNREMKELQNKMQEFPQDMPLSEMQDAQAEMNLSEMSESMSQCAGQCQGGNCKNASAGQKKTAQQLRRVQKKMEQVKKKMNEDMKKLVEKGFKKALDNVLSISKKQEELRNRTARLPQNSQQFRDATQEQMELAEELARTADDLMELAKKTFAVNPQMAQHLGKSMKQMQESLEKMQERDSPNTSEKQGGAMTELNESAKELAKGMNSSQNSQGGSGSMMMQLQQMAGQQQTINMQSMQIGQGGMSSQQQAQQMQRLLSQQRALQKSLQDLNEEAKRSDEGRRLSNSLEKINEEMQEVIRDMESRRMDQDTYQKQDRILSRMLDASRSVRERDWEKTRKAETAKSRQTRNPGELDPSLLDPKAGPQTDLQRAVNEGYSKDYEGMIRTYFENLQKAMGKGNQ